MPAINVPPLVCRSEVWFLSEAVLDLSSHFVTVRGEKRIAGLTGVFMGVVEKAFGLVN